MTLIMKTDLRGYSLQNPTKVMQYNAICFTHKIHVFVQEESASDPSKILEILSSSLNNDGGLNDGKDVEMILT